ncbi:PaaI family thioesterase [Halopseudomonas pelagia]|uniref:PaaI family thioesterase n=1 Tax=Halopseudomonas pelagia TaxID=553151 RepID=UPI0003B52467|nr:PaaI family thioesterase [Halopseudomonas pelagia]|tara:strand:+ start:711 stop:1178 length:468 start_codon:yes stop_codon:yes gene_type:complete
MTNIPERARSFLSVLRHCQVLGMTVEQADEHGLIIKLPYSPAIIGNPVSGVVHGGAITTLMDTCCGISTVCYLPEFEICPTLDLRIDYMHPAEPGRAIYGFAQCYRISPTVIFTRGVAYQDDREQPIAHVVGTFMRMGKPDAKGQLSRQIDGEVQ